MRVPRCVCMYACVMCVCMYACVRVCVMCVRSIPTMRMMCAFVWCLILSCSRGCECLVECGECLLRTNAHKGFFVVMCDGIAYIHWAHIVFFVYV